MRYTTKHGDALRQTHTQKALPVNENKKMCINMLILFRYVMQYKPSSTIDHKIQQYTQEVQAVS